MDSSWNKVFEEFNDVVKEIDLVLESLQATTVSGEDGHDGSRGDD